MIDRLPDNVSYYESPDELFAEDDIIETDVHILGWNRKLRIRALTFGQMAKINRNATAKKDDKDNGIVEGELQNDLWTYWTLVEGITRPRFKIEQAQRFADSNGEFVKSLADEIWNLGRISKKTWDAYIETIKVANAVADNKIDELNEELQR